MDFFGVAKIEKNIFLEFFAQPAQKLIDIDRETKYFIFGKEYTHRTHIGLKI